MILFGRYRGGGDAAVTRERRRGRRSRQLAAAGEAAGRAKPQHDVLAKVWARQKIEDLMQQTFYAGSPAVEEMVTAMALDYKLMSQYTSFVAVDTEKPVESVEPATPPRRMLVPVPLPEGTRWEGFFGPDGDGDALSPDEPMPVLRLGLQAQSKKEVARLGQFDAFSIGDRAGRGGGGGRARFGRAIAKPTDERKVLRESGAAYDKSMHRKAKSPRRRQPLQDPA